MIEHIIALGRPIMIEYAYIIALCSVKGTVQNTIASRPRPIYVIF